MTATKRLYMTPEQADEYFALTTSIRRAKEEFAAFMAAAKFDIKFLSDCGIEYPLDLLQPTEGME